VEAEFSTATAQIERLRGRHRDGGGLWNCNGAIKADGAACCAVGLGRERTAATARRGEGAPTIMEGKVVPHARRLPRAARRRSPGAPLCARGAAPAPRPAAGPASRVAARANKGSDAAAAAVGRGKEWLGTILSRFGPATDRAQNITTQEFEKPLLELD
jgi:hypothetical protein